MELRHEGVEGAPAEGRLEGTQGGREVGRFGRAIYVCVTRSVHGNAAATVKATAAEVRRVDKPGAGRIQFRHETIKVTGPGRLKGAHRRREIDGIRDTRHVGVASGIHRDAEAAVDVTAAEVSGVEQRGRVNDERPARIIGSNLKSNRDG